MNKALTIKDFWPHHSAFDKDLFQQADDPTAWNLFGTTKSNKSTYPATNRIIDCEDHEHEIQITIYLDDRLASRR